jgi:glutamyl-tRNA synthetase
LKKWKEKSGEIIDGFLNSLNTLNEWNENYIKDNFENYVQEFGFKFNEVASPLRLILTGKANGPSLFEIMEIIGKEETINRLSNHEFSRKEEQKI